MGRKPELLLSPMAKDEDQVMTFFLLCFLALVAIRAGNAFKKHLARQEEERRKFYLAVADDFKKLDKMIAEDKTTRGLITTPWAGRN